VQSAPRHARQFRRRAIFDYPDQMAFQRTDDSFASYGASVNLPDRTLALTKSDDENWAASFTFQWPAGISSSWMAGWTIIRFIWSFN